MKKVLFVGEHPFSGTGNANMMCSLLGEVDKETYQVDCFGAGEQLFFSERPPCNIISATSQGDEWGHNKLLSLINGSDYSTILFVGIDIWRYHALYKHLKAIQAAKKFYLAGIFPYELNHIRTDWMDWFNIFDKVGIYSEFGYNKVKDHHPNVQYFRPGLHKDWAFSPLWGEDWVRNRKVQYPTLDKNKFVVGIIAANQIRKDLQTQLKGFFEAKKRCPELYLHLHTELGNGAYNLHQYIRDLGFVGDISCRTQGALYSTEKMVQIYNSLDILLNCTLQEGLSWTPIEAAKCGTPAIVSNNTAHIELMAHSQLPSNHHCYIPVMTGSGESWVETTGCDWEDIAESLVHFATIKKASPTTWDNMRRRAAEFGTSWCENKSDLNEFLSNCRPAKRPITKKVNAVLFAQHSSAGDILMTTQCFKELRKRHPNLPFIYMTQEKYWDIIQGNPYVDEIIGWDDSKLNQYRVVYNPHGEHILHGNFNRLDVKLHSLYPYFCKIDNPEYPHIETEEFNIIGGENGYIVVNTAGADKRYRSYPHMGMVRAQFPRIGFVQIGSEDDELCPDAIDLRGKLSYRQAANVMLKAKAAVCIDSFPAHLAGAMGTPVVVLYGPAPARVTEPRHLKGRLINIEPNWLEACKDMRLCWGNDEGCFSPCIHSINPFDVAEALKKLNWR